VAQGSLASQEWSRPQAGTGKKPELVLTAFVPCATVWHHATKKPATGCSLACITAKAARDASSLEKANI